VEYTWDSSALAFRDESGNLVPRRDVRGDDDSAVDEVVAALLLLLGFYARRFVDDQRAAETDEAGSAAFAAWEDDSETAIRDGVVAAAAVGAGGLDQLDDDKAGRAEGIILFHLAYFRGFVGEVEGGLPLDGRFPARAEMYAGSAVQAFESVFRAEAIESYTEERRLIGSERPCGDCIGYAGLGWQPAGSLPGIGESCECKGRCRCSFEYRIRKRDADDD
jgi:hypothetical protein